MFRHRPQPWAAMEFLLAGYKKSRTRILLQQLLLMLLRTLAVVVLILMLAGPKLAGRLAELLGGQKTHHVILIDDSFSMSDRNTVQGGQSLFEDALSVTKKILDDAAAKGSDDRCTIILASHARRIAAGDEPELMERPLDAKQRESIDNVLRNTTVSELSAGPEELLTAARRIVTVSKTSARTVVYLLSDFRTRNWEHPERLLNLITELKTLGAAVRAIRATDTQRPNIALRQVRLVDGIHAADVELLLDVTAVNYGTDDAANVPLSVFIDGQLQPGLVFPQLKAGDTNPMPLRFPIRLTNGGTRRIQLQIPPDPIEADNSIATVLTIPEMASVLLVTPEGRNSRIAAHVRAAIAPGGVRSGVNVRTESPRFLATDPLQDYNAIILLDVSVLDQSSLRSLEKYAADGGGVAFFIGAAADAKWYNAELYRNGNGLLPVQLIQEATLAPDFLTKSPDIAITATDHPVFRLFDKEGAALLAPVKVERYVSAKFTDTPSTANETASGHVLARLRNGSPLVVERLWSDTKAEDNNEQTTTASLPSPRGRSIAFMTTTSGDWNTWSRSPSFVIMLLDLVAYLSRRSDSEASQPVETPLVTKFDPTRYEQKLQIVFPKSTDVTETTPQTIQLEAVIDSTGVAEAKLPSTPRSGIYTTILKTHDGTPNEKYTAVNPDPNEGDTRLQDLDTLMSVLREQQVRIESMASFATPIEFTGKRSLSDLCLLMLAALLAAEMFLAGRIIPPMKR
jgi:hypothetical protein